MLDTPTYDVDRPATLSDLVGNTETWARTAAAIASGTAGHLILVGPAGCGKSAFLRLALADQSHMTVECTANAGLRDVRDTLRTFARGARTPDGHYRWVVFEHADALAADTQAFLRRMLETTSATTRIVFECRDVGAITEPILSRCTLVNVRAPDDTELLFEVQRRTQFSLGTAVAAEICALSHGNLRAALLSALAVKHAGATTAHSVIAELLTKRPPSVAAGATGAASAWVAWAVEAERTCRDEGVDLRDVLRLGWPCHPTVAQTCAMWSRLGGTSPRSLFFDCVGRLSTAPAARAR
jgi:DNA polymerase III delta prime subunit